ncbi:MAG: nitroreductase family protein [Pseudomonadota bacterium]
MQTPRHQVDASRCKGDGICVEVCPKLCLELHDGAVRTREDRAGYCIACGQCVAVCPNMALALDGVEAGTFEPVVTWNFSDQDLFHFLAARRSVRAFKDKPVERALIDRVLEGAALAPPSFPPHSVEILVLDGKEDIARLGRELVDGYGKLQALFHNPIARGVIRLKRGAETMHALKSHVLEVVQEKNAIFAATGEDRYLSGAPVLMLFHACRWSTAYTENALLVASHAMLAAHALGLGATLLSIVPPLINNMGEAIRPRLGLPDDNRVVIAMILGHPKYKFRQAIRRSLKSVRYL